MDWLLDLGKQAPVLSVLVWVVHRFLTYMEKKDAAQAERDAEQREALKVISGDCHENQRAATAQNARTETAIKEHTAALTDFRLALAKSNGGG